MGLNSSSQCKDTSDAEAVYNTHTISSNNVQVVYQNIHKVVGSDSLFYTPVSFGNAVTLNAMMDSGSMACTINEDAKTKLSDAGVITVHDQFSTDVVLIGCGGRCVSPKSAVYLNMEVYGYGVTLVP